MYEYYSGEYSSGKPDKENREYMLEVKLSYEQIQLGELKFRDNLKN